MKHTSPFPVWMAVCAAAVFSLVAHTPAQAIDGGQLTTDFKALGQSPGASNVQIADNWVITARHVSGTVGSTISNFYGTASIAAVYNFSNAAFPENDLTLLRLNTALAAPQISISSDIFAPGLLATPLDVTIASARNATPRGFGFASLREVESQTDPDDAGPLPAVTTNFLLTYGLATNGPFVEGGDSGGALFLGHVTDQVTPLLGITSAQLSYKDNNNVTRYGSAFVQLAMYRSWIDGVMLADLADNQSALWVSSVPEPATAALWLGGLAWVLASANNRTRKRRG
jgi:Trypsin